MQKKSLFLGVATLALAFALAPAAIHPIGARVAAASGDPVPAVTPVSNDPVPADFTGPSELVQSDNERGREWARYIVQSAGAKTDMEKIRAIYAWYVDNMRYNYDAVNAVRDLPRAAHAALVPRHDYLTVLASVAAYVTGESEEKPKSLCGGFAYGVAGSLRALGIPVQVRIGEVERAVRKGEAYFDAAGVRRVSEEGGETPHTLFNGKWIAIRDLHARPAVFVESHGRWIYVDPTFDAIDDKKSYFDMDEATYRTRWKDLYVSSERMPRARKENPLPEAVPVPPPAHS